MLSLYLQKTTMEEVQSDSLLGLLNGISWGGLLLIIFTAFIIVLVIRTFRNKPSA